MVYLYESSDGEGGAQIRQQTNTVERCARVEVTVELLAVIGMLAEELAGQVMVNPNFCFGVMLNRSN